MSQYKPGETSEAVIKKKNAITKSILKKAELIDNIESIDDIYSTLNIKGNTISEAAVLQWNDDNLGIVKCSWNTARTEHNAKAHARLLKALIKVNKRLSTNQKEIISNRLYKSNEKISIQLRQENEDLKRALAEVYRAYMQLVERFREDQEINDAIRQLILDQAQILGQQRVWEVK
ncbi:hypothetical protein [Motiliproteus sp.]|uniref:hypothetical protein n=1 Tax=Motiliproteus sp. TaxID=1898955 RepID=UPI003BA8DE0E